MSTKIDNGASRLVVIGGATSVAPNSKYRPSFPGIEIPMLKIRRSRDRLIFNMGIPILVRHLYIETSSLCNSFEHQAPVAEIYG